ncbi:MAG: dTDP-4-amino-4,6-dideoxygalactose transaminase [Bacteroidetes bacterium RIFCSPHIGHO2_02_FULL_44_7]|nr:MAG: dTDP-4-amino-4,6-dideoxygalactose transaminase [Bacteroidetes bacterium RIFCSPHIGHO2_02_FULL_44_7]
MIPFNQPYLTGKEGAYIEVAFRKGKFSGNGYFTQKCHHFFEEHYGFGKCFLTNSATNALEMAALLAELKVGDEVIVPSYTFVSTANPFALLGAKLVFCDSQKENPNISANELVSLISARTKVIVVVHYAGLACDMDSIMELANRHGILVVEDAAHAITARYKERFLGSIGHLAAVSFHETKNISCGQGGMLIVNDPKLVPRAEKIWAKGTNRLDMERGIVDRYEWVDVGSSFYPSEITAALLYAQLEVLESIQQKRQKIWDTYNTTLDRLEEHRCFRILKPGIHQSNNYHIFCLFCRNKEDRDALLLHLKQAGVLALFHYLPLHKSPYIRHLGADLSSLPHAEFFADTCVRLPLYAELSEEDARRIAKIIHQFFVLHPA